MKKLLTFLLVLFAAGASAQIYHNDPAYGRTIDHYEVRKSLHIPTVCGTPNLSGDVLLKKSAIAYDSCGHRIFVYDPSYKTWSVIVGGSGSGITKLGNTGYGLIKVNDSTYIGDTIYLANMFVKKSDTTKIVINHKGAGIQTVYASNSDTLHIKNLQGGPGVMPATNSDSSISIITTITGAGAPTTAPAKIALWYLDTTNKKVYIATGTTSSSDWIITN